MVDNGHLGLWEAVGDVFPKAKEQLCSNHKSLNLLDALPKRVQAAVKPHLTAMMYAETRSKACEARKQFEQAFRHRPTAIKTVVDHWDRLTSYYDFPWEHWKHLQTWNVVESPSSRVHLRTRAFRRFKTAANATWLIWKTFMVAEKKFRKLNAPHLVEKVAEGRMYTNGVEGAA